MSGDSGIHVHAAHHGDDRLSQWVALFTALLAALGAVLGYQGNRLMNEVLLEKNQAVLYKAHATDQWNYYQAVSTKMHLMEMARILSPAGKQTAFDASIAKYKSQKSGIKATAEHFDAASEQANAHAEQMNAPHERLAMAMILFQIAVALASVTALTKRGWLLGVAGISAVCGIGLWVYGMAMV
ncbi:MAG: DUF4337 domain-containing protein [Betaproteobacteria bacterium]|nr:DUF4337 domain-containing protein [Betaproteobacteria bacterium]